MDIPDFQIIDQDLLRHALTCLMTKADAWDKQSIMQNLTESEYVLLLIRCSSLEEKIADSSLWDSFSINLREYLGIRCFQYREFHLGICQFYCGTEDEIKSSVLHLEEQLITFCSGFDATYHSTTRISIGRPFQGLTQLRTPYCELIHSIEAFSIHDNTQVLSEYDIQNAPELLGYPYPHSEIEIQFATAIVQLEFRRAQELIKSIMEYERNELRLSLSFLPRMSVRIEWILIILQVPRNSGSGLGACLYQYPSQIQFASDIDIGIELVQSFFKQLDDYYGIYRFNIGKDISQITSYIREHIGDTELSETMICDRFRISSSYLSRLFHQRTGMKLVDFIHFERISKAKNLLQQPQLSISEIARTVGYVSNSGFSTTFKKYENITPTEYRKMILAPKNETQEIT